MGFQSLRHASLNKKKKGLHALLKVFTSDPLLRRVRSMVSCCGDAWRLPLLQFLFDAKAVLASGTGTSGKTPGDIRKLMTMNQVA